jgi:uncharacterized membrane protein
VTSIRPVGADRAALLGAASGSRSTMGLAALAVTARDGWLARPPVRLAFVVGAAIELVIDKLPITPSRLQARGLISRATTGAASGAIIARRVDRSNSTVQLGAAALIGAAAAVTSAVIGAGWRQLAARNFGGDWPGAVAEDIASATVALVAVRS